MKTRLCGLLCLSSMVWAPSLLAAGSILIEPFPTYSEADPLVVESPVTFRWHQGRALRIEIRSDEGVVFPRHEGEGVLDSGVSFRLDPGAYEIWFREIGSAAARRKPLVMYIYVPQTPQTIDIRGDGPAVNVHLREVRKLLEKAEAHDQRQSERVADVQEKLSRISDQIEDVNSQLAAVREDVAALRAQFVVTEVSENGNVTVVDQPLQRLFNDVKTLEADLGGMKPKSD